MTLITDHGSGSSCVMGDMGDADNGVTQVIIITILSVTGHQCWSLIVLINIVTHVLITNIRLHQSCIPHIVIFNNNLILGDINTSTKKQKSIKCRVGQSNEMHSNDFARKTEKLDSDFSNL